MFQLDPRGLPVGDGVDKDDNVRPADEDLEMSKLRIGLEVAGSVPDLHLHLLVVQGGLVLVDFGHLRRIVVDEAVGDVPNNER